MIYKLWLKGGKHFFSYIRIGEKGVPGVPPMKSTTYVSQRVPRLPKPNEINGVRGTNAHG